MSGPPDHRARVGSAILGAIAHSGLLVAAIAVALSYACAEALGGSIDARAAWVVATGSLAVYSLDRRVDDRVRRDGREDFAVRHESALLALGGLSGLTAVVLGLTLPFAAVVLLGLVVGLALAHARLRHIPWFKPLYIATAWTTVVVLLPALLLAAPVHRVLAALVPVGGAVIANVIACDVADREAEALHVGPRRAWWVARSVACAGCLAGVAGPAATRPLALVPAAIAIVLFLGRGDRTTAPVLDAALGVGAVAAWLWLEGAK